MGCPIIVVTGPIASGKTTVARMIAGGEGAHISADLVAHGAFRDGAVAEALRREFGDVIVGEGGEISRSAIAAMVFRDQGAMDRLNDIVKPVVTSLIEEEIARKCESSRYIVLDAVLFFEYKFRFEVRMVVLVDAPPDIRQNRLMRRDGISQGEAAGRIASQRYLEHGWAGADVRIDTSAGLEDAERQAAGLKDRFLSENGL